MKAGVKLSLFLLLQTSCLLLAAQEIPGSAEPDDEMNIFLLSILTIFFAVMIGAAIIGAFAAALVLLLLSGLFSLGILSASLAIGLYKRSFASGFKTFLHILFGLVGSILGCSGLLLVHQFIPLPLGTPALTTIGLIAGCTGGIIMGLSVYSVAKAVLSFLAKKANSLQP